MTRPEPRPYEVAPDASWFDVEPANANARPASPHRARWLPDLATMAVIVSAAFVFALLAVIVANRFVF